MHRAQSGRARPACLALLGLLLGVASLTAQNTVPLGKDPAASAVAEVQDLLRRARADLHPPLPEKVPAMESWLASARRLVALEPWCERELARVRAQALPYDPEARARDEAATQADRTALDRFRRERDACRLTLQRLQALALPEDRKRAPRLELRALVDRYARLIAELEVRTGRRSWAFANPRLKRRHAELSQLLPALRRLGSTDTGGCTVAGMELRMQFARTVQNVSVSSYARRWKAVREGVRASALYGGLDLQPQTGLVPLGPDPESGLQEFAHLQSGTVPARRRRTRRLILRPDSGIVLVLVPGGRFLMGAQKADEQAPRFDPLARIVEGPVHPVMLEPFFLGKHEVTQGQWRRMTGSNPSRYRPGMRRAEEAILPLNPVESVTRERCAEVLLFAGLTLPTEAQWEYAARAGTLTPWWCGIDRKALAAAVNVADESARRHDRDTTVFEEGFDDGHVLHVAAGTLPQNPWGFEAILGNVWEWCRGDFGDYRQPVAPGDGLRKATRPMGLKRGGSFRQLLEHARATYRGRQPAGSSASWLGLRAARAIDR